MIAAATLAFSLTSATFANGATIPTSAVANRAGRCTGGDRSPALAWHAVPHGTREFALVAYDVTAHFTHWLVVGIPAATRKLDANAGVAGASTGTQLANSFGDPRYDGPCPPPDGPHRYVFTLYALSGPPDVAADADREAVLRAIRPLTLASASVSGTYGAAP